MSLAHRRRLLVAMASALVAGRVARAKDHGLPTLSVEVGGQVLAARLVDNPTTRDLLSLLPLELVAKDYMATEKVAYPPRRLSVREAPASHTPVAGDVTYYAPWGNLALFHADGHASPGLVLIGRFEGRLDALRAPGEVRLRIASGR